MPDYEKILKDLVMEICGRREKAFSQLRESKRVGGVNSPGFNQDLGEHDGLTYLMQSDEFAAAQILVYPDMPSDGER